MTAAMKSYRTSILVAALLAHGCITAKNPNNWLPQDAKVRSQYYVCLREAQQGYSTSAASVAVSPYGGSGVAVSNAGSKPNYQLLQSCMQAQGYEKREATGGEIAAQILLFPIYLPLCIIADDCTGW